MYCCCVCAFCTVATDGIINFFKFCKGITKNELLYFAPWLFMPVSKAVAVDVGLDRASEQQLLLFCVVLHNIVHFGVSCKQSG
jgi:hypothetical protein